MSSEAALTKCVRVTNVSDENAKLLLHPMSYPENEHEKCFLVCYFKNSNKIRVGKLKGTRVANDDGQNNTDVYLDVFIGDKNPLILSKCIDESEITEKCDLGFVTRLCHIKYAKVVANTLAMMIENKQFQL